MKFSLIEVLMRWRGAGVRNATAPPPTPQSRVFLGNKAAQVDVVRGGGGAVDVGGQ